MQEEAQGKKMERVNTSYTTVSDSNGYYTFSNLPAGTYFLQPIQPGQTFVPESRSVTVPVSANGQDFKRTSTPPVGDMILIPAGYFQMGCSSSNDWCGDDEKPLHTVYLYDYAIDKYEVTNARYKACVDTGGCSPPHETGSASRSSYYDNPDFSNYPVIHVDWSQTKALCELEGKRLPAEAEWEKAARGPGDTRIYPWGNAEHNCTLSNSNLCVGDTSEVGSYTPSCVDSAACDGVGFRCAPTP